MTYSEGVWSAPPTASYTPLGVNSSAGCTPPTPPLPPAVFLECEPSVSQAMRLNAGYSPAAGDGSASPKYIVDDGT
jgi:hypothetical protein